MTKRNEIEILKRAAKDLGPNSYCGKWLADAIPSIEFDLNSDLLPTTSYMEAREKYAAIVQEAKDFAANVRQNVYAEARGIEQTAKANAERILERAHSEATSIRGELWRDTEALRDLLERFRADGKI